MSPGFFRISRSSIHTASSAPSGRNVSAGNPWNTAFDSPASSFTNTDGPSVTPPSPLARTSTSVASGRPARRSHQATASRPPAPNTASGRFSGNEATPPARSFTLSGGENVAPASVEIESHRSDPDVSRVTQVSATRPCSSAASAG